MALFPTIVSPVGKRKKQSPAGIQRPLKPKKSSLNIVTSKPMSIRNRHEYPSIFSNRNCFFFFPKEISTRVSSSRGLTPKRRACPASVFLALKRRTLYPEMPLDSTNQHSLCTRPNFDLKSFLSPHLQLPFPPPEIYFFSRNFLTFVKDCSPV